MAGSQLGSSFNATTAAETRQTYPVKGRLVHVSVTVGTGGGPVFVSADLKSGAFGNSLLNGWARGNSISEAYQSLSWDGDLPIPEPQSEVVVRVRNDTGVSNDISVNIVVVK